MRKRQHATRRIGTATTAAAKSPVVTKARGSTSRNLRVIHFEPISYVNLTDQVYEAIKKRILAHEFDVGSKLRDEAFASQLGVSRTPIREAMLRLSREGLVEIIPRSGTRVRAFTEQDIEDIFDLRIALEALAIRKAATRLESSEVARLREMQVAAETALKMGDSLPALEFDLEMHRTILERSGNKRLQEMMATINDFVSLFRNIGAGTPFHRGFTYRHSDIIHALERRDPDLAARVLSEHIEVAKKELFRDFRRRDLLPPPARTESPKRTRSVRAVSRGMDDSGGRLAGTKKG